MTQAPWLFARDEAAPIASYWQASIEKNPKLFNGIVFLLRDYSVTGETFHGTFARTDFRSYLFWRDHDYPDPSAWDCFGSALLQSAEGHILLGRQRAGHINAGLAYPPGGFIDARDVGSDGRIDIAASTLRELVEETGVARDQVVQQPGVIVSFAGRQISIAVRYQSPLTAVELSNVVDRHIAADREGELIEAVVVRAPCDIEATAPPFAKLLLQHVLDR